MRKFYHTLLICVSVMVISCSEDGVTPHLKDTTQAFLPADDDNSEEAQMRREFYQGYGSFLLFNDTLQHEALGKDVNGDMHYFTEVLDLNYQVGMSTESNEKFNFIVMTDLDQKRIAVQYIKDYLLVHLTGKLKPYSWLLVDKIQRDFLGSISYPYVATGQRSVAVACNLLPRLTDAQKAQYTTQVMNTIIAKLVTDNASAFEEFFHVSLAYYDGEFPVPSTNAENTALLNQVGFISRGTDEFKQESNGLYPNQEQDIKAYARLVVANSAETLQSKYTDYPLVLEKIDLMRETLKSLGYVE
ncbi:MAG: hypothetical protein J6T38_03620 [Bacteroidaceae bacterium]|nr:hypothetical protein [Bacteroidaceae bacterium]